MKAYRKQCNDLQSALECGRCGPQCGPQFQKALKQKFI